MADAIGTAFVNVALDPKQLEAQVAGLGGKMESGFGKFGGKWGLAAATGFGAAIAGGIAAGKYLYDVGAQFDDMADTIRVSTGKTGKQLDVLVDTAKKVGTDVPTDFESAGKAVATLSTRLDVTGKPLRTLSDQMLELSRLSGTDLTSTLNSVTRMLGDAGLKGAEASKGIDELWRASQATQVPITRLADLLTKFGGPMRQLGFSFEEQAGLLGKFEKEGVNTELVMGSMRIALGKMAKAGKDPVAALHETIDAIRNTGSQADANRKAIELFGARAGPDMAAAIREGRFSIDDLVQTIAKGHDTVLKAGQDTADFSEQWQLFKNQVAVAVAPAAEALFTAVGQGMAKLNEFLPTFIDGVKNIGPAFGGLKPMLDNFVAVVQDLMPVFKVMADAFEANVKRIIATAQGLATIVGGILKVIRGLLEGDWSMVWDGAKQIVQGFIGVFKAQLDYLVTIVKLAGSLIGKAATALGEAIKDGIMDGLAGIGNLVMSGLRAVERAITGLLGSAGSAAKSLGTAIVNGLMGVLRTIGSAAATAVSGVRSAITGVFSSAASWLVVAGRAVITGYVNAIKAEVGAVVAAAGAIKSAVVGAFAGAGQWLFGAGQALVQGFVGGIKSMASAAADAALSVVHGAIGAFKGALKIGSPSQVFFDMGTDTVQGFVDGLSDKIPAAEKAAYTMAARTVAAATGPLKAASDNLSAFLTEGFQATTAAAQTPAEKKLAVLQAAHDAQARQQALADAQEQQRQATTDDEKLRAAQAVEDAKYAIQVAALEKQAATEKKAQEGRQFVRQQQFDSALKQLQGYLDSAQVTAEGARKKIAAFMDRFDVDFTQMGKLLGSGFEQGIRKATKGAVDAARDMADAVKDALKVDLKIKSPSRWMRDEIGVPVVQGIAAGIRLAAPTVNAAVQSLFPSPVTVGATVAATPASSASSTGTLYGKQSAFAGLGRNLRGGALQAVQPAPTVVRVYIGDEELRGIVRTEVGYVDDETARILLAGAR